MPRNTPLFLALDQGGHASRAMVIDGRGRLRASAQERIATLHPGANRVEHDPAALLDSIRRVCSAVARQLGSGCRLLQSAGLATQRSTVVCWDKHTGKALSPVISWQDRRAARRVAALSSHQNRVHEISGLMLSPHYGASKIAWCLENLKSVQRALSQQSLAAGPLASFMLFNLLDGMPLVADPVNASRTLLWGYHRCDWSPELLALFDIPASILPRSVFNRYSYGHLMVGKQAVPVTVVTGDQSAALFAGGKPEPDSIYINLGTGAFIQRLWGNTPPKVSGLLASVLWQERRNVLYVSEGTVNGAASALEWLRQTEGVSEKKLLAQMPAWLADDGVVPVFLNGISGLGSPYWIPDFRSRFIGNGDIRQKSVAVAESVVFLCCANLKRMNTKSRPVRRVVVSGGLARWDGLCQRLADLSGLNVVRPAVHEATALGIAWLLGARPRGPLRQQIFRPHKHASIQQRYAEWQAAMKTALARR